MAWWHGTTIYQVYPRSFADSDGDGVGDLNGIIERLDHIAELGIQTLWVSPFFAGPQRDFGYDISDYRQVAPEFGTMADAERLIDGAHTRGIRVMLDLVLNHTSDQHPWFLRSRSSRHNPKADWYIWADGSGRNGRKPPNNWRSALQVTSAWQYEPTRKQWYLASFLPFQPDLNWRNPDVRAEMFDVVRFWLDKGVDGFRLDIFGRIMKDAMLRDNPLRPSVSNGWPHLWASTHTENTAESVSLAAELRRVVEPYDPPRILLGEVFGPAEVLQQYLGSDAQPGLHLVFLFDFLTFRYDATWFHDTIAAFERAFPAPRQPTYVLENHDRSRSIDRVGGDPNRARVLAFILLTLRGVPTLYMGQEIGMSNTYLPLRDALDPVAGTVFRRLPEAVNRGLPERLNRDEVRTPMQWTGGPNAGFCPPDVQPWLPVNTDSARVNVAAQSTDPDSLLSTYRALLDLRRTMPALRDGRLDLIEGLPDGVLGYRRTVAGEPPISVYANLGEYPKWIPTTDRLILGTRGVRSHEAILRLAPDNAAIVGP